MDGTFQQADMLTIENLRLIEMRVGDVVAFHPSEKDENNQAIVHRIARVSNDCFFTKGDNNLIEDHYPVNKDNFIGRVIFFERKGKIHRVWNGRFGVYHARVLQSRQHLIRSFGHCIKGPYHFIKKTNIIAKIWHPEIKTIHFETQDGPLVKYIHKGKTVASCWTDTNRWWFRRPYDFVVGPKLKN